MNILLFRSAPSRTRFQLCPTTLLQAQGVNKWILDAKNPSEEIRRGRNVEQAFSYAIHRDVRVRLYGLCNGREFVLFHISEMAPIMSFKLADIKIHWDDLYRVVSPLALTRPDLLDFRPDFGVILAKLGFSPYVMMHFPLVRLYSFGRVSDELFTANANVDFGDGPFAASFDFSRALFEELLSILPEGPSARLREHLTRQPYILHTQDEGPVVVNILAHLSAAVQRSKDEAFIPLEVQKFDAPELE